MSINAKPITEVPVIEELSEGDKLLVNSGGAAKQIDASKVGGSGGGGSLIYVAPGGTFDGAIALGCFRGKERIDSNMMSYDEFVSLMSNGVVALSMSDGANEGYLTPMMLMPDDEIKAVQAILLVNELQTALLVFSDSNVDLGE